MKYHCGSIHPHDDYDSRLCDLATPHRVPFRILHPGARLEHKVIKILVPFTAAAGLLLGYVSRQLLPVTWRGNLWRTLLQVNIHFYVSHGKTTPICRSKGQMHGVYFHDESISKCPQSRETVPTTAYPARQRSCHDQWLLAVAAPALRLRQRRCCVSEHSQEMLLRSRVILPSFGSAANSCGWTNKSGRSGAPCWYIGRRSDMLVSAGDIQWEVNRSDRWWCLYEWRECKLRNSLQCTVCIWWWNPVESPRHQAIFWYVLQAMILVAAFQQVLVCRLLQ